MRVHVHRRARVSVYLARIGMLVHVPLHMFLRVRVLVACVGGHKRA